jgi:dephospho-CoA kinase
VRVGLTGGIASGKSTVSAELARLGATVIDYDLLAREVVEVGTPGLAAIAEHFGPSVIADDGTLNRPALGSIVFADADARRNLEAITHPAIRDLAAARELAAGDTIVVHDNPLLVEMGAAPLMDEVIVVDVNPEVQLERMRRDRGMTLEDARARIGAQLERSQRLAAATYVIDNDGSLEALKTRVHDIWAKLQAQV